MIVGRILDLGETGSKQRFRAHEILPRMVMKGRGDLNDSLEAAPFFAVRFQPDFFPGLVRFEKVARVEVIRASREFSRELFTYKNIGSSALARRAVRSSFSARFGLGFQNSA
ncbi:MAG TPA: hypothetical protein VFO34_17530 [Candidatus Acidoferrales bacterium]|nr:hypothetical protein [Candidatus Acidoferrales bacterium]